MSEKTFKASNGYEFAEGGGELDVYSKYGGFYTTISEPLSEALCEFFQAERDKELGLWRDPENPDYVAKLADYYPPERRVMVHNERSLSRGTWRESDAMSAHASDLETASVAKHFFEAHPVPKPWDDAKPGEVWRITARHDDRVTNANAVYNAFGDFETSHDTFTSHNISEATLLVTADGTTPTSKGE